MYMLLVTFGFFLLYVVMLGVVAVINFDLSIIAESLLWPKPLRGPRLTQFN